LSNLPWLCLSERRAAPDVAVRRGRWQTVFLVKMEYSKFKNAEIRRKTNPVDAAQDAASQTGTQFQKPTN